MYILRLCIDCENQSLANCAFRTLEQARIAATNILEENGFLYELIDIIHVDPIRLNVIPKLRCEWMRQEGHKSFIEYIKIDQERAHWYL